MGLLPRRLLALVEDEWSDNEKVGIGAHEAAVGVRGGTHDWLSSDVEGRVHDDRASGPLRELVDHPVVEWVHAAVDGLDAGGVVHVGDGGNLALNDGGCPDSA